MMQTIKNYYDNSHKLLITPREIKIIKLSYNDLLKRKNMN